jgi:tRNA 2-thiouridine synthesizing protein A
MKQHPINALRLLCPMPVIRVQEAIENGLESGAVAIGDQIVANCSDPGAMHDIPAWAKVHGHKLVDAYEKDGEYVIVVEVCNT